MRKPKIREGSNAALIVAGKLRKVRVVDICADSVMVEFVNGKQIGMICQISELMPVIESPK